MRDYKEMLEKARVRYDEIKGTSPSEEKFLLDMFSELAESDDEIIRKGIISTLKFANHKGVYDKYISWLEKQGESTLIEEIKRRKELYSREKEKAVLFAEKLSLGGRISMLEELLVFANEKQGEQKPADKVIKLKFHEGDWVILTAGELSTTLQIVKVDTNKRLYWFNDSSYLPIVDEECLHLWTIQDAKDGDVLSTSKKIFIYNGNYNTYSNTIGAYCSVKHNGRGLFIPEEDEEFRDCIIMGISDATPATKEQCDLLFQKMKEEGYEWDAEKKEPKKIENKPDDLIDNMVKEVADWSEKDEENLQGLLMKYNKFLLNHLRIE